MGGRKFWKSKRLSSKNKNNCPVQLFLAEEWQVGAPPCSRSGGARAAAPAVCADPHSLFLRSAGPIRRQSTRWILEPKAVGDEEFFARGRLSARFPTSSRPPSGSQRSNLADGELWARSVRWRERPRRAAALIRSWGTGGGAGTGGGWVGVNTTSNRTGSAPEEQLAV